MKSLNEQITKLKGLCWHEIKQPTVINDDGVEWGRCKLCNVDVPFNVHGGGFHIDYENNIVDAWSLFEELPKLHRANLLRRWVFEEESYSFRKLDTKVNYKKDICEWYLVWIEDIKNEQKKG